MTDGEMVENLFFYECPRRRRKGDELRKVWQQEDVDENIKP